MFDFDAEALIAAYGRVAPARGSLNPAGDLRGPGAAGSRGDSCGGPVAALIRQSGGKLLADVRLFDVYRGGQVPAGKKSLAYALTFQAPDRTLIDEDTAKLRAKIVGRWSASSARSCGRSGERESGRTGEWANAPSLPVPPLPRSPPLHFANHQ